MLLNLSKLHQNKSYPRDFLDGVYGITELKTKIISTCNCQSNDSFGVVSRRQAREIIKKNNLN